MDFNIGPIDIGDLPGYNLPEPTISLVNYDAETGIVEFSDGSTYNTKTSTYTAGEQADANTQVSNQVYATRFGERAPQIAEYFDRWQNLLSGGMDIPKDVDKRDDAFNETIYFTDPNYQGFQDPSPITWAVQNLKSFEDIRTLADLPEYLSIYDEYQNSEDIITSETVSEAYWTLLSGAGPEAALSEYYGTDITLGDTTGANYTNISKYGDMGEEEFKQFQSIIKPILEMSVPYVMMTQGLEYADAVEYTYTHDPMAAAVYTAYGVDLYRQTGDGSTYIFDPILGQEMRTLEVKDPNLRDIMPSIAQTVLITAATVGLGQVLGQVFMNAGLSGGAPIPGSTISGVARTTAEAGSAASIAANATAAALITAAQGGDLEAALQAAVFTGGGEFLADSNIVKATLDSLKGYLNIPDGFDINLTLGNAGPSAGAMAGSATASLKALFDTVTGSGGSGGATGTFCFAPPCEPGTVFVGNAFAGTPADELTEEVLTSWTLSGSGAASGTATITGAQFWDEFKNQWYNYKPDENNVTDPNANLPDIEILSEDPEALGAWGTIAAGIYSILPGTATIYDEDGNPIETNVLRAYIEGNFDKFANDLKAKFKDVGSLESVEKLLTKAAETGNEDLLLAATTMTAAGGSLARWFNTLSILVGEYDSDSALGTFGQNLIDLADAKTPEDFKAVSDAMGARLSAAVQTNDPKEIAKAIFGNLESAPREFFYSVVAGELGEEALQAFATKAIDVVSAGTGKVLKKVFGTVLGPGKFKLADRASELAGVVNDGLEKLLGPDYVLRAADKGFSVVEAFAGGAEDTYDQAYEIVFQKQLIEIKNRNPQLTDAEIEAQAADIADTVAQEYALRAGVMFTIAAGVSEAVFGNEVFERVLGRNKIGQEFSDIFQIMGVESLSEFIEEGGTNIYQQLLLAELDPNKEFSSGEAWASAFIGGLAGGAVAGTSILTSDVASVITGTLTGANRTIADIIGRAKQTLSDRGMAIASAQLAAEMDTILGDMQGAARDIVYFNVMNEVNDAGYTSTDELRDVFSKYDGTPTPEQFEDVLRIGYTEGQLDDVTDAFSSLEGFEPTYEDLLNILNGAYDGSNAQQAVLDYANPLYKSREEVLAAAEAAGVTLTETQITNLIGRGDDTDIGTEIQNLLPDTNNPDAATIAHIDYDNGIVYYKDGTTYNLRTGEFGEGTVDTDGNVEYNDGTTYSPDDNTITNTDGTQTDPNVDQGTDQEESWFDRADDAARGVANTLWSLYQRAVDNGDDNSANGFLDIYRNYTGVDTQPPDYVAPDDEGDDTGQDPDPNTGQDPDPQTGIDLTNLLNQLVENGATTEDVNNLRVEIIGLLADVASQESVDRVQGTVDQILDSLTDVAKQSTLTAFRDQILGLINNLASQSSVDSLSAKVDANEAAGMGRDEAIQKAIKDLSVQLGVGVDELAAAINQNRDAIGDIGVSINELNGAVTTIQGQIGDLATRQQVDNLQALMEQYQAQNMSQFEALQRAIADISVQTGQSPESVLAAIAGNRDAINQLGIDIGQLTQAVNNIQNQFSDLASQESVDRLEALITQYQNQGLDANQALQQALQQLSSELGVSVAQLSNGISQNRDAINQLGVDISQLNQAVTNIQNQLSNVATRDQVEALSNLISQYEQQGLSRDQALQRAIQDLSAQTGQSVEQIQAAIGANQAALNEFGLSINDLNSAVSGIQDQLSNVASQESVDTLEGLIAEYQSQGLTRDQALQRALQDLSRDLDVSVDQLARALGRNQDAISQLGLDVNQLNNAVTSIQEQLSNVATQESVDRLQELVTQYEQQGLSRDESLQQALQQLSTELGVSVEQLASGISQNQDAISQLGLDVNQLNDAVTNIQEQLQDVATQESVDRLQALVTQYEQQGLSRDQALQQALQQLSTELGVSVEQLAAGIGQNQDAISQLGVDVNQLNTAVTNIQEQLQDVATRDQIDRLQTLVTQYEQQGFNRDQALQQAIQDLASETNQSFEEVANAINNNQFALDQLGVTVNDVVSAVNNIQEELKNVASQESVDTLNALIQEYEAAGIARSEATQLAISDLATQLGVTEQTIIDQVASTEQRLSTELDAVSQLIGKPPSQVTQVDIDFVADIIAQQEALGELMQYTPQQLGYDVNNDGIIDVNDLTALQQSFQGEQVDLSQAQQFQPTGLYDFVLGLNQQTQAQLAAEAEKTRQFGNINELFGLLAGAQDITGRQVTVETPDPARIGYLYDFSSIFATPQQEGMFVSPYGSQRGYAKGGTVFDANDELLKLLGE
jgi:hypothetical protein